MKNYMFVGACAGTLLVSATMAGCSSSPEPRPSASVTATPPQATAQAPTKDASGSSATSSASAGTTPATRSTASTAPTATAPPPNGGHVGGDQSAVLSSLPGSSSSGCVDVGTAEGAIRSGSMAAGDFAVARKVFAEAKEAAGTRVSLYFIPRDATKVAAVEVTARPAAGGAPVTVTSSNVDTAEEWTYVQAFVPINAPGVWHISARMGSNTGCFRVTFAA